MKMNLKLTSLLFLFVIFSCSKPNPEEQKQHLEGYWEIKNVEGIGKSKDFSVNLILDYIEVNGDKGIRTKVNPKLDGSFENNGMADEFSLRIEEDSLRMYYKTPFDEWNETVLEATETVLKVKNKDNKIYTYSKFEKFDFDK